MIEHYLQIKSVHVAAVVASGTLFAARGALMLAGSGIGMAAPVRHASYAIDTVLLTAALALLAILHPSPAAHPWLQMKVGLLFAYVVLGSFALRRARTPRGRATCFGAALLLYSWMVGIALAHHPLSWLRWAGGP